MLEKIKQILNDANTSSEEKFKQIIALAVIKDEPRNDDVEKFADELTALRTVIETLGNLEISEVHISPRIIPLLCAEMERRNRAFLMTEAREVFGSRGF